jgi:hypothetical protein
MLPEVLKRWTMANPDLNRTPAYFNSSLKAIEKLLKPLSNPEKFILADPVAAVRDMINNLEDLLKIA